MVYELGQVSHCSRIKEMHHSKVSAPSDATVECVQLVLWCGGVCPEPVLDVHAPVHDIGVADSGGELFSHASTDCAEGRAEVPCYNTLSLRPGE